jgi:hypothetical protein
MLGGTPSPASRRLMKTPSRGTLSPKGERAGFSHRPIQAGTPSPACGP